MPIPETYAIPISDKEEFELLPEDVYVVEITKLELKSDQPVYQSTELEDKFAFEFTIQEDGGYKGRKLWLDVRTSMSAGWAGGSPSWLYKIFCAVNGIMLNEEDLKTVTANNVNEMIGKSVRLVVKQKLNTKGVLKNKIEDVMALKGSPLPSSPLPETKPEPIVGVDDIPF